jgi:hypothetical protein
MDSRARRSTSRSSRWVRKTSRSDISLVLLEARTLTGEPLERGHGSVVRPRGQRSFRRDVGRAASPRARRRTPRAWATGARVRRCASPGDSASKRPSRAASSVARSDRVASSAASTRDAVSFAASTAAPRDGLSRGGQVPLLLPPRVGFLWASSAARKVMRLPRSSRRAAARTRALGAACRARLAARRRSAATSASCGASSSKRTAKARLGEGGRQHADPLVRRVLGAGVGALLLLEGAPRRSPRPRRSGALPSASVSRLAAGGRARRGAPSRAANALWAARASRLELPQEAAGFLRWRADLSSSATRRSS